MLVRGDAEAFEERGGFALGDVTVLLGDHTLELAEPNADLVRDVAGEEALLLVHRVPEGLVAHEHGVDDAVSVVFEMVLLEHAETEIPGDLDRSGVRVLVAREHLDEGGFAGAVGSGEAITLAGIELHRDVLEEDLRAKALGDFLEQDHGMDRVW